MRFNVYGRFVLEIIRASGQWQACRVGEGIRRREGELIIPAALEPEELLGYLEDVYHEYASPGRSIQALDDT